MTDTARTLLGIFRTTDFLMPLILGDLTDAQGRHRARGDDGPSVAWTVGHLLHYRHNALALLGQPQHDPYAERFGEAGATAGADYPTLAELGTRWTTVSARLTAALEQASDATFARGVASGGHDEQSVLDKLAFMAFHEGYHVGVIGALRKSLGLAGPAERVAAQAAAR